MEFIRPTSNPRMQMAVKVSRTIKLRAWLAVFLIRLAYRVGGISVAPVPTRQDRRRFERGSKVMSNYSR